MPAKNIIIKSAAAGDVESIQSLYAYHVEHGLGTFEEVVPTVAEMQRRFDTIRQNNLPYLIAKIDGEIVGYAYANYFRERSAYRFTLEDSIYVSHLHIGLGIGEALLSALINECRDFGAIQLLAVIGDSYNQGSIQLHRKLGFESVGVMQNVGYKFERFVDVVIMQLNLVPSGE